MPPRIEEAEQILDKALRILQDADRLRFQGKWQEAEQMLDRVAAEEWERLLRLREDSARELQQWETAYNDPHIAAVNDPRTHDMYHDQIDRLRDEEQQIRRIARDVNEAVLESKRRIQSQYEDTIVPELERQGRQLGPKPPPEPPTRPTRRSSPVRPRRGPSWWPRWLPRWVPGLGAAAALGAGTCIAVSALSPVSMPLATLGDLFPSLDALSWGDTHLVTFDGVQVDFQAVGEFVLIRSEEGDLEVQVRQQAAKDSRTVSLNVAVAANVAGDRVSLDSRLADPLLINGEATDTPSEGIDLPNGGRVEFNGSAFYSITWPDGSVIDVPIWNYHPRWLEVRASLADSRAGSIEGLLGDADGDPENDLIAADGTVLSIGDPSFDDVYGIWGDSWRVSQVSSLFAYAPGESTATFADMEFPDDLITVDSLTEAERSRATRACREAGVTHEALLDACVLDVAVTGAAEFAQAAAALQAAWMGTTRDGAGQAHLEVTGEIEDSIDLSFDREASSNPLDGFMVLQWENEEGQQLSIGSGHFTGTRTGVTVQMQLVAGRPGFSHDAFGDECAVTFDTLTASALAGSLSCQFSDVQVEGTLTATF